MPRWQAIAAVGILAILVLMSTVLYSASGMGSSATELEKASANIRAAFTTQNEGGSVEAPPITLLPVVQHITTVAVNAMDCTVSPELSGVHTVLSTNNHCQIHIQRSAWPVGAAIGNDFNVRSSDFREGWSEAVIAARGKSAELCLVSSIHQSVRTNPCEKELSILSWTPAGEFLQRGEVSDSVIVE
jgi:hypothetical protein